MKTRTAFEVHLYRAIAHALRRKDYSGIASSGVYPSTGIRSARDEICTWYESQRSLPFAVSVRLWGHGIAHIELPEDGSTEQRGTVVLSSCGYHTVTTKERLNWVLQDLKTGMFIFQKDHEWYVNDLNTGARYDFRDGFTAPFHAPSVRAITANRCTVTT